MVETKRYERRHGKPEGIKPYTFCMMRGNYRIYQSFPPMDYGDAVKSIQRSARHYSVEEIHLEP
jgi:hypothetical protein